MPLSISAVADFSASPFYVFFHNGVSSTSRTSDATMGEPPSFPFSFHLRPFCRKLSRIKGRNSRARIKCQIFWKCKQVEAHPFSFGARICYFLSVFLLVESSVVLIAKRLDPAVRKGWELSWHSGTSKISLCTIRQIHSIRIFTEMSRNSRV